MTYKRTGSKLEDLTHPKEYIIHNLGDLHIGDYLVRKIDSLDYGPEVFYYEILDISSRAVTIMYHMTKTQVDVKLYGGNSICLSNGTYINLIRTIRKNDLDLNTLIRL
jgi:hypothetical protein